MAVVPGPDALGAVNPRPVTPVYQNPNAANGTFGEEGAVAMQRTGAQLQEASSKLALVAQRVQTRQDVVARARDISAYRDAVDTEYNRVLTEGDLSSPDTVKSFAKFSADKMAETLAAHSGSQDSRALLESSLSGTRSKFMDDVAAKSLVAQKAVVGNFLDGELRSNISAAIESPGTLQDRLAAWKSRVDEMAPGLGTVEAQKWQKNGDEEITRSVVSSFIDKGQYGEAEKILRTPGVDTVLSGDVQRSLNAKLISGRAALYKEQHAGDLKLQAAKQIMGPGWEPTPAQRAKLAGVDLTGPQPLSDKITAFETAMGPGYKATPEQIAKLAGASTAETSPFSDKDSGVMLDLYAKVADGTASPRELAMFQTAATNYTQARFDPVRGETLPGKVLPAPFQDALDHAGLKLTTASPSAPGQQPTPATEPDPNVSLDIFGNAKNLAGIVPSAGRTAAGMPVVGEMFPSPQMTQLRTSAELLQRDVAKVLQDDPRIRGNTSATERQAIADQLNIVGGKLQPDQNFENHLVGVDRFLQQKLQQAQSILARGPAGSSRDEYVWARRAVDAISNLRFHLNAPPMVKRSEYPKWAQEHPGSAFVGEDGIIRTAPGGSGQGK